MRKLLALAIILAAPLVARATAISGKLAVAGLDTYSASGVTFVNPGVVLLASSDFAPLSGAPLNLTSFAFASADGTTLFSQDGITATILSFAVDQDTSNFLNANGVVRVMEAGFTATDFSFTLTSTRPDGTTSYTADLVAVPEPWPLVLVGTGMMGIYWFRRRYAQ